MLTFLTRMFKRGNADAGALIEPSVQAPLSPKMRRLDELGKLDEALRNVIQIAPERIAGRLFVLSLDSFRGRVGNAWSYMGEKAKRVAFDAVRDQLSDTDIVAPVGPVDLILMLGGGARKDAAARAVRLDQTMMVAVTGEDLGPLNLTVREVLFDEKADALTFRSLSFLDLQRSNANNASRVGVNLEAELVMGDDDDDDGPSAEAIFDKLVFVPQPIVNLNSGAVVLRRMALSSEVSGRAMGELEDLAVFEDPKLQAKLDLRGLRAMRAEVKTRYARKETVPMSAAVSFETLANAYTRNLYLKLAQRVPAPMRRRVVYEITGIPAGVALGRLIEISGILRPFCSATMMRLDVGFSSFAGMQETGAMAIAPDCALDVGDDLDAFCRSATANRLKMYAGGVDTAELIIFAREVGIDYGFGLALPEPPDESAARV